MVLPRQVNQVQLGAAKKNVYNVARAPPPSAMITLNRNYTTSSASAAAAVQPPHAAARLERIIETSEHEPEALSSSSSLSLNSSSVLSNGTGAGAGVGVSGHKVHNLKIVSGEVNSFLTEPFELPLSLSTQYNYGFGRLTANNRKQSIMGAPQLRTASKRDSSAAEHHSITS